MAPLPVNPFSRAFVEEKLEGHHVVNVPQHYPNLLRAEDLLHALLVFPRATNPLHRAQPPTHRRGRLHIQRVSPRPRQEAPQHHLPRGALLRRRGPDEMPTDVALRWATGMENIDRLLKEAHFYENELKPLQGTVVPRFYGFYVGKVGDVDIGCTLVEWCGGVPHVDLWERK